MTTVVNNPAPANENGGNGFLIGVVIVVIFLGIILYFAIPAINNMQPVQVNVPAPQINVETPEIVIPETPGESTPATE